MSAFIDLITRGGTRLGALSGAGWLNRISWKGVLGTAGATLGSGGVTGVAWASPEIGWRIGLACKPIKPGSMKNPPKTFGVHISYEDKWWGIYRADGEPVKDEAGWGTGASCYRINIED